MMPQLPDPLFTPYGQTRFMDNLPAYDLNEGTDTLLELMRVIQQSGNYYWVGSAFPTGPLANLTIPANGTVNGSIPTPVGSYVTAITYYNDPVVNPEGFKFKLWDKGTKAPIVYGGYVMSRLVASDMVLQGMSGIVAGEPYGPAYLTSPLIVTPPGLINWEIVNLSVAPAVIQMMLSIAVPINNQSIGTVQVKK